MADSADTFLGVVITLAVITAIASGASGGTVPTTTSTPGSTTTTTSGDVSWRRPGRPISRAARWLACTGELISTDTVDAGGGALTLEVFYAPVNGGRNCAIATKTGSAAQRPGAAGDHAAVPQLRRPEVAALRDLAHQRQPLRCGVHRQHRQQVRTRLVAVPARERRPGGHRDLRQGRLPASGRCRRRRPPPRRRPARTRCARPPRPGRRRPGPPPPRSGSPRWRSSRC